jgi:hypothetical protein
MHVFIDITKYYMFRPFHTSLFGRPNNRALLRRLRIWWYRRFIISTFLLSSPKLDTWSSALLSHSHASCSFLRMRNQVLHAYKHRIKLYCGTFTPWKNCDLETRSLEYATINEAVFFPYRAELCRVLPSRASPPRPTTLVAKRVL